MKHRNLYLIETRDAVLPGYFDELQAWTETLPEQFTNTSIPPPKATLLCGLPGVGKGIAAKVIARILQRPLFLLDGSIGLNTLNRMMHSESPCVLWIDRPGDSHLGVHRWLLEQRFPFAYVVFTTEAPHRLSPGFMRTDAVNTVWHLDLPDLRQRSALWGDLLFANVPGFHEHDSVTLGQLSPMCTAAEIRAAFDQAMRLSRGVPRPSALIDSVLALKPVAITMDEHLACLRAWTWLHARSASSKPSCREV